MMEKIKLNFLKMKKKSLGKKVLVLIPALPLPLWGKCFPISRPQFPTWEMHHFPSFFYSTPPLNKASRALP